MASNKKTLILLSSSFPYGNQEPLLAEEINYLAESFKKIIIISAEESELNDVILPLNVSAIRYPARINNFQKFQGIKNLLSSQEFWEELKIIQSKLNLKISLSILKTILSSYTEGKLFKKFLATFLTNQEIDQQDLYFYSWWCRYQTLGLALLKQKNPSIKVFTRMHGYDLYFERHAAQYLPFRTLLFNNINAVFFISEQGKKYIAEKFKENYTNHYVSKLGVKNHQELKLLTSSEVLHIISCSSLIPLKRIHLIIEALAALSIPFHWTHFGDGELKPKLEKLANDKIAGKYTFFGFIKNDAIHEFYLNNSVHLFINVSETEGIPISIMEAYSFGIPAIATDVGGVSELVNNKNGYLISKDCSPIEIAKIIEDYSSLNVDERNKLRLNAYKKWKTEYNADKNTEELIKIMISKLFYV